MFAAGFVCGVVAVFVAAGVALVVQEIRAGRRKRRDGARLEALLNESLFATGGPIRGGAVIYDHDHDERGGGWQGVPATFSPDGRSVDFGEGVTLREGDELVIDHDAQTVRIVLNDERRDRPDSPVRGHFRMMGN